MAFPTLCALGARGDNPPIMRVDGNLFYKTIFPTDFNDCSGRYNPSRKGGGGYGLEGLQPVAYEVDV